MDLTQCQMDASALEAFLAVEFAEVAADFAVERVTPEGCVVRLKVAARHLRPGGTVSGPSMFALADVGGLSGDPVALGPRGFGGDNLLHNGFHAQTGGGARSDRGRSGC